MSSVTKRYLELIMELRMTRLERELKGGELSQSEEAEFVAELDLCWNEMTDEGQCEAERELGKGSASIVQSEFWPVDEDVEIGSRGAPRHPIAMAA